MAKILERRFRVTPKDLQQAKITTVYLTPADQENLDIIKDYITAENNKAAIGGIAPVPDVPGLMTCMRFAIGIAVNEIVKMQVRQSIT